MVEGPSLEDFITEGKEGLKSGGREGFTPEGLGISDLISSEYARGRHLANYCFTSSSPELRSGQIPEGSTAKTKLETPHDFQRLNPINANGSSRRFSRAVQTVEMPSVSSCQQDYTPNYDH